MATMKMLLDHLNTVPATHEVEVVVEVAEVEEAAAAAGEEAMRIPRARTPQVHIKLLFIVQQMQI